MSNREMPAGFIGNAIDQLRRALDKLGVITKLKPHDAGWDSASEHFLFLLHRMKERWKTRPVTGVRLQIDAQKGCSEILPLFRSAIC